MVIMVVFALGRLPQLLSCCMRRVKCQDSVAEPRVPQHTGDFLGSALCTIGRPPVMVVACCGCGGTVLWLRQLGVPTI